MTGPCQRDRVKGGDTRRAETLFAHWWPGEEVVTDMWVTFEGYTDRRVRENVEMYAGTTRSA